jgi:hypothetical protein
LPGGRAERGGTPQPVGLCFQPLCSRFHPAMLRNGKLEVLSAVSSGRDLRGCRIGRMVGVLL